MDLAGRVALVTGAGQRLGRAFAAALAGEGARVALHYHHSGGGAAALQREIREAGGVAEVFEADLRDAHAARDLPVRVAAAMGQLDVLVNSAAVMERLTLEDTTVEQYDEIMHLNLRALFFTAQGAAPVLRAAHGTIVNIADLSGIEPWPSYAAHSLSKAGVIMLTKVLARTLAPSVRVNAIAPGTVMVPDSYDSETRDRLAAAAPLRRLGTPSDAVEALLYLVQRADFVTGAVLPVDGGRLLV